MHSVECSVAVYLSGLFGTECTCLKNTNGSLNIDCR